MRHVPSAGLVLLILLLACSTVVRSQRPPSNDAASELNRLVSDQEVKVTLTTSPDAFRAADTEVGIMNTALIDAETARRRTVPTAALQRIELPRQHARGALEGAGLGAVAGALVGAMLGFLSGDDRCPPTGWCFFSLTAAQKAEGGAIVLGAGGLLIGTIIGAIAGHTTVLEFDPPPPPPRGN